MVYLLVTCGETVVVGVVITSDRWYDTNDQWYDSSGMWCTY